MTKKHNNLGRIVHRASEEMYATQKIAEVTSWPEAINTFRAKLDIQVMNHNGYKESDAVKKRLLRKHETVLKYLENKFGDFYAAYDYRAPLPEVDLALKNKIWMCWWQGEENAPEIVRACIDSVRRNAGEHEVIVITDSHTTTHGAFGAFGTGVGATDLAVILATGRLWFKVPEVIRINLTGEIPAGVYAKDIVLSIIGKLKADYAVYKAVEFAGPALQQLSISERMALCNMTTEMGAKTSYIQPDAITLQFLKERGRQDFTVYETDADYVYAADLTFDVSEVEPQLAAPFSVDNVQALSAYAGMHVDQAYLGSCTGGRTEDFAVAAKILAGQHIPAGTRMVMVPASKAVLAECLAKGYIQTLLAAGATLTASGCAACLGIHQGLLAADEVCLSSTNRNFPGRMGSVKGRIYLGSPASVAAAARNGVVTDPRQYLDEKGEQA